MPCPFLTGGVLRLQLLNLWPSRPTKSWLHEGQKEHFALNITDKLMLSHKIRNCKWKCERWIFGVKPFLLLHVDVMLI